MMVVPIFCAGPFAAGQLQEPRKLDGLVAGWEPENGNVLLGEAGCLHCHKPEAARSFLPAKSAPLLGDVGARVRPQWIAEFLKNPQATKPGTPMPDLLAALPAQEKEATTDALVHFLASLGGPKPLAHETAKPADIEHGRGLFHTVGCVACHAPHDPPPKQKIDPQAADVEEIERTKPEKRLDVPLPNLARKMNATALTQFLLNPLASRPAGRMPNLKLESRESSAIAAYLISRDSNQASLPEFTFDAAKVEKGRAAFVSLGCASCHSTGVSPNPEKIDLKLLKATVEGYDDKENRSPGHESPAQAIDGDPKTKYLNFGSTHSGLIITLPSRLIVGGVAITSANDYPDRDPAMLRLEGSEDGKTFRPIAEAEVPLFTERFQRKLIQIEPGTDAYANFRLTFPKLQSNDREMQIGELELFAMRPPVKEVASTLASPTLEKLRLTAQGSCLSESPAAGRPRFAFSAAQRAAVTTAVKGLQSSVDPWPVAKQIDHTMSALRCYSCHARGEKGGPAADRANYFTYEKLVDLGDEGRLPPPLHEVGAKLTAEGFSDMLIGGLRYRTAMATRMPQFGRVQVAHLPEQFNQADAGKIAAHAAKFEPKYVPEGRKLIGKNTLACINCHAWAGARLPGAEGLDLIQASRRLQPAWFYAWLSDPQKIRPRTRMPTIWNDGKSPQPAILGGNQDQQIDALWAYLSAGDKGGPPQGLSVQDAQVLRPTDEPLVFRTFLDKVGAHSVLVGHKEGTHVAFDANRLRMVLAWHGDFVSPNPTWEGRAGEYTKLPAQDILQFPESPPLAVLSDAGAPWPADVVKKNGKIGSSRTPEGWEWRGYRYDTERRPIFRYTASLEKTLIEVEETALTEYRASGSVVTRRFKLTAASEVPHLHFLAAAGKAITPGEGKFVVDDKVTVKFGGKGIGPATTRAGAKMQELIVPLKLEKTAAGYVATFDVVYEW